MCKYLMMYLFVYPKIIVPKYLVHEYVRITSSSMNIIPVLTPLVVDYQHTKTSFYIVLNISQRMLLYYIAPIAACCCVPYDSCITPRGPVNCVNEPTGRLKRIWLFPR